MRLSWILAVAAVAQAAVLQGPFHETNSLVERQDCPPSPRKKPAPGAICGLKGHVTPTKPKSSLRFQTCTDDYLGCYGACYASGLCQGFSYNEDNKQCRLFASTIEDLKFVETTKSPITFWDFRNCFKLTDCQPNGCGTGG